MIRTLGQKTIQAFSKYKTAYQLACSNPTQFWKEAAKDIKWGKFPQTILDDSRKNFFRWFPDGTINITQNCLDRHLPKLASQPAYYYESPITGKSSQITYQELHQRVAKLAQSLKREFRVKPGDRVMIYMPMVLESIVAQLACARIGAIHVTVFGGFAASQLAVRIRDCKPVLVLCANAGKQPNKVIDYLEIIDKALEQSQRTDLPKIIYTRDLIPQRPKKKLQYDFLQVQQAGDVTSPILLPSTHPLYILYTSGTTGAPKGTVRDHGGTSVILQHTLKNVHGLDQGDGLFASSDVGWVVGHSFITYGPLIGGLRSVLFEGKPVGTPNAGVFWRIIQKYNINHLYTSPTAMRTIRKNDPHGSMIKDYDLSNLRGMSIVGQKCDSSIFNWIIENFPKKFINETYWQTETGSPILSNYCGKTWQHNIPKAGSSSKPYPGYNASILNPETGKECAANETGIIVMKAPLPPSFMLSLWNRDDAYVEKYFQTFDGYYNTGDSGFKDQDGYYYIMSSIHCYNSGIDDVINTAGHRLSTGEMEEVLQQHKKVAEAIVVGMKDQIKGEVPVGFVTLKHGHNTDPKDIEKELVKLIREQIGPVASFKVCHVVTSLPKTRSGKYLRYIVRKICNQQQYKAPSTVQNMEVVHQIEEYIKQWLITLKQKP